MTRLALGALLALTTAGCAGMEGLTAMAPASSLGRLDAYPSNSLVGQSPTGGGGYASADVNGATSALFQTSIGPVAWKGVQLARMASGGPTLLWNAPPDRYGQAMAIPQASLGWAVGYGIARYQAGAWDTEVTDVDSLANPTAASSQRIVLTDVSFASGSASVGYAVGTRGTILRYEAATKRWIKVAAGDAMDQDLGTVKVLAANDVWVAGKMLLHFDGATWTRFASVPGDVSGLAVVGSSNIWASTGSGLYQWNGTDWQAKFTPETGYVVGAPQIAVFGSTIVGLAIDRGVRSGVVFMLQNGVWKAEQVTVPDAVGLDSIVIANQTTAYANSYDGVYRFDLPTRTWSYYSE